MKLIDNYSKEITELSVMKNGVDVLLPLLKSSNALMSGYTKVHANEHTYEMTTEQIDWWKKIAANLEADVKKEAELIARYGEVSVEKYIAETVNYDSVANLHALYEKAFGKIEAELGK